MFPARSEYDLSCPSILLPHGGELEESLQLLWSGLVTNSIPFCWPLQTRISLKTCGFFSRFRVVVFDGVPVISEAPEATYKLRLRALEGRRISSKSPSRVPDMGVAGSDIFPN